MVILQLLLTLICFAIFLPLAIVCVVAYFTDVRISSFPYVEVIRYGVYALAGVFLALTLRNWWSLLAIPLVIYLDNSFRKSLSSNVSLMERSGLSDLAEAYLSDQIDEAEIERLVGETAKSGERRFLSISVDVASRSEQDVRVMALLPVSVLHLLVSGGAAVLDRVATALQGRKKIAQSLRDVSGMLGAYRALPVHDQVFSCTARVVDGTAIIKTEIGFVQDHSSE